MSFSSWLGGQGGYLNPKLKAFTEVDDNGDRGILAKEDIEEGQQLMLIPLSCCLHMPTQQDQATSQVSCWLLYAMCLWNHNQRLHLAIQFAVGSSQCCN